MIQVAVISEDTLQAFETVFNETCANLSRFTINEVKQISETSAQIFYETGEEAQQAQPKSSGREPDYVIELDEVCERSVVVELRFKASGKRYCCECGNYSWGVNCPYRDGTVRLMDNACPMFNIIIDGGAR